MLHGFSGIVFEIQGLIGLESKLDIDGKETRCGVYDTKIDSVFLEV